MFDIPDLESDDATFVAEKKAQLPGKQRAQAEQIVNAPRFRDWIVSPLSAKLLVHWDHHATRTVAGVSPLSVFCATISQALSAKPQFMSALWFCGLHGDADSYGGAGPMLASLISQLLRQYHFDFRSLGSDVDLSTLQAGVQLLEWLVRQLPETMTLVLIIDGVVLFERPEVKEEALPVFASLVRLAADPSVAAAVKVLFMSTPSTHIVRAAFEDEDLILNVDGLPRLAMEPNDERMVREFEEGHGEGDGYP